MQYRSIGDTGIEVSVIGLGGTPLGNVYRNIDEDEGIRAVRRALELGINFFDVGPYDGLTRAETLLGRALQGVPRDRYVLSTKVGRYGWDDFDYSPERIRESLRESMERLRVDRIDLVHLQDVENADLSQITQQSLPALRRLRERGLIRAYGITAYPLKVIRRICERAEVDIVISHCRCTLHDEGLLRLIPELRRRGVAVINAAPFAMGMLTDAGAPAWHPAPEGLVMACARAARFCRQHGEDLAALALRFSVTRPGITATLAGSARPGHVEQIARWFGEEPSRELVEDVRDMLSNWLNLPWASGRPENDDDAEDAILPYSV